MRHYTIGAQTEKAIGYELESLAIDIVLIAPPCTIWYMSSDFGRGGPVALDDERSQSLRPMLRACVRGGVSAICIENATQFLDQRNILWHGTCGAWWPILVRLWRGRVAGPLGRATVAQVGRCLGPEASAWLGHEGHEAFLRRHGYRVVHQAGIDSSRLPHPVAQKRVRSLIIAMLGRAAPPLREEWAEHAARTPWRVMDEFPECKLYHHQAFVGIGQRGRAARREFRSDRPAQAFRTNVLEAVGFNEGGGAASLSPSCWKFSLGQCARLQGFPADWRWPRLDFRCPCPWCHKPGSRYNVCAAGKLIGNSVASSFGRFAGHLVLGQLGLPRLARRRLGQGW